MHSIPSLRLNNGVLLPQLGYGVYKVPAPDCSGLVRQALETGYRSIDTAALYGNEEGVGQAVRDATGEHGWLERSDIFVTSKVWNDSHGYRSTLAAFAESMERLGLEYLDLYLIHWPCPERNAFVETYKALEKLYHDGAVRAIGVSNFSRQHLERLLAETSVVPAVNQVELHPLLQQRELREFHARHGMVTEAWSPLARGSLLGHPGLGEIAVALGVSPARVALRWQLQLGNAAIPKSSSRERMAANLDVFNFRLDDAQMAALAALDAGTRSGSDPDTVN
jgi:diketogulonate reductase-like aldo/keto reductase